MDPLQSFLPSDVEMASRNQMRSALLPLRAIAAKQGCAVLIVMHSNKKQGVSGRARLADSSDIWDMARSVLMMGRAKNDGKIYLSHEKNSYARPQQTVLLHIDDVEVEGVKTARAVFDGYTDKKDADFIEERRVRTAETRQDTRSAILNVLSESRLGRCPATSCAPPSCGRSGAVTVPTTVCTVSSQSPARSQSRRSAEKMAGIAGIPATVEKHLKKFHFKY